MRIVLASGSPRRREMLEQSGLTFEVRPADIDETPRPGEAPAALVARLAAGKADAVPGDLVIAADTVVALGNTVLNKPADDADAAAMLAALSGRAHDVITGFCVRGPGGRVERAVTTRVNFRPLDGSVIARYVASGEPRDKAGAYGIQGIGAMLAESVHGSYTNVVGLPLVEVLDAIAAVGGPRL